MTHDAFFRSLGLGLFLTASACGSAQVSADASADLSADVAVDTTVLPDAGPDVSVDAVRDATLDAPETCQLACPQPPAGCRYVGLVTCSPPSCGTVVCPDAGVDVVDDARDVAADTANDAPSDAPSDARMDGSAVSCGGSSPASFPTFSSACAASSDCVVAVHQSDCCGNQRGMGINASERAAFDAAEALCRPMYPRCGCPTRGILADDEQWTFSAANIVAVCMAGRCVTSVRAP